MLRTAAVTVNGFLFQGTTADLSQSQQLPDDRLSGGEVQLRPQHDGGPRRRQLRQPVDHGTYSLPLGPGHAFIYDIATQHVSDRHRLSRLQEQHRLRHLVQRRHELHDLRRVQPRRRSTISTNQDQPIGHAYLVDYDSATGKFSNWTSFDYPHGTNFVTHFEGISSVEKGVYTLNADSVQAGSANPVAGFVGDRPPQRRRLVRHRRVGEPQLHRRRPHHQHHQLQFRLRQSGGRRRDRPGGHGFLPGDRQRRLPVVERDQRQRRQRHRPVPARTTTRSP